MADEKLLRDLTAREADAFQRLCQARDELEVVSDAIAVLLDRPALLAGPRHRVGRSRLTPLGMTPFGKKIK
jgi:hypothetical protein